MNWVHTLENYPANIWNPYSVFGAGGVILLKSLAILRNFESAFGLENNYNSGTHPTPDERIQKFYSQHVLQPELFANAAAFLNVSNRVMNILDSVLDEMLDKLSPEMVKQYQELLTR